MADLAQEALVDLVDDLYVTRQDGLEELHRPGLQRFRHQGVVGVGEDARGDVPGLVPVEAFLIHHDTHQFGDGDGRMGVVQLDRHLVGQGIEGIVKLAVAVEDVGERGGDEEILLLEAQLAAHHGGVVGIEHLG